MLGLRLRHRRHIRIVLLGILPARVLMWLLVRIEGLRRARVKSVGVDVNRRLRRRAIHVTVVLLLSARLFVIWDLVARAHMVVIHGGRRPEEQEQ